MKTHFLNHHRIILSVIFLASVLSSGCVSYISEVPIANNAVTDDNYEYAGTIEVKSSTWNWFFKKSAEERLAALSNTAYEKALAEFGSDIIVKSEVIDGNWSPASLLMLFNTIGFVEDASMRVSVWRLKPEPVKEEIPVNYGIRYLVIPREDYTDENGFMLVEYRTREELEEDLLSAFNNGDFNKESLQKKQSRLPDTGKIFITLGREDITNAISRWFSFICSHNGKTIFKTRGIEDIPYVYGTDRLWWNDMSYNVDPEWDGELKLEINDSYQNRDFFFRIVKEIYEIPAE